MGEFLKSMPNLLKQIVPFLFAGIALVAFAFGVVLLAYLFLFGAIVGLVLFLIALIRAKFFPTKNIMTEQKKSGRIIDSDDWKRK